MEHFFTPTLRLEYQHDYLFDDPLGYTEVRLADSIEAFMNHPWDWSAFYAFATDEGEMWKIIWITEDTCIWVEGENNVLDFLIEMDAFASQRATITAPSGETHQLVVLAMDTESLSLSAGASSVFWHAVTTSNCVKLRLQHFSSWFGLCSGPVLLQFLETSPSLELLEFEDFAFEEAHCRALATLERTDLEVTFEGCSFEAQGARGTFIEWLRRSQVVTKLEDCEMEDNIISALSGNSSVKTFSIDASSVWYSDDHIRALALALPGNQGIENLRVSLRDETWSLLLRSLRAHPRIQSLTLGLYYGRMSAAAKTSMMNAVLRLVQCNTVMHTIEILPDDAKDEEFLQNFILPRLEMNRSCFENQRQALTRADPSIRGQLLGRALHVVRYNPDLLFRFLSENVPAFIRSDGPVIPLTWCCWS
jgi:hypothetical protein